jgi:hypothetical protein
VVDEVVIGYVLIEYLGVPCHCHCTIVLYPSSSVYCSYEIDNRAKTVNLQKDFKKWGVGVWRRILTVKGKATPLQAWAGPEGTRRLRLPDFKTIGV